MFKRKNLLFIGLVLIFSLLVACSEPVKELGSSGEKEKLEEELVDMSGRSVYIPDKVDRVFSTGPVGTIVLYSLNPEKMVGWNYDLREGEKGYILEDYHELPNLGGAGRESINIEEVLKEDPDLLIIMEKIDDNLKDRAEELEKQIGKPVLVLDDRIEKLEEAYRILGRALREEERAEELARYCKETLEEAEERKDKIDKADQINVYYAEGPNGLETEPAGSWHGELIDIVGGNNVARVEEMGDKGKSEVSIEQVLEWDPEIIISWDDERGGYYSEIFTDPAWQNIKAVEDGEVYEIPNKPFNWFDRPPSVNRILGVKWLGNLLYPDIYDYNIEEVVKEFYQKFYHYQLSDKDIKELLGNSTRN